MKNKVMILSFFYIIFYTTSGAQDLSNFYQVTGFKLTPLKSGQYVLTLSPSYFNSSFKNNNQRISSDYSSKSKSDYPQSYFNVNSSFLWGMSEQTTVSLFLRYTPKQSLGQNTQSSTSIYTSIPSTYNMNYRSDNEIDNFQSAFIIAHRLRQNLEFSLDFNYYTSKAPRSGSENVTGPNPANNINYDISSLDERQNYSITFNIVLLGN